MKPLKLCHSERRRSSASGRSSQSRNLLFRPPIRYILFAVLFSAAAVAQEVPQGWRRPTLDEAKGKWRNESCTRFLRVIGDFDGDRKPDVAELLVSRSSNQFGLFVRLSSQQNQWQSVQQADGPIANLGVSIVPPKRYMTLCGSDPSVCAPDEPGSLDLRASAINFFSHGSNSSFVYWDRIAHTFHSVPKSD
jgi:hypothetical protein